jgi:hypothetical protein
MAMAYIHVSNALSSTSRVTRPPVVKDGLTSLGSGVRRVLKDTTGTEAPVPQRKTIDLTSNDGNNKNVEGGVTTTPSGKLLSTAKAHTTGGRHGGASRSSDGRPEIKFTLPVKNHAGKHPSRG